MKYVTKSKDYLVNDCRISCVDGVFYQDKPRAGLSEIKPFVSIKNHKYGKAIAYQYVAFYNYTKHKQTIMQYGTFLYAWYKGEVPAGYDVDHIDGDTFNNSLDNLRILTHAENIQRRSNPNNQYKIINKKLVEERKLLKQYKDYYKSVGDTKGWHLMCRAIKNWDSYTEEVRQNFLDTLLKVNSRVREPILFNFDFSGFNPEK